MKWDQLNSIDCVFYFSDPIPTVSFIIYDNEYYYHAQMVCGSKQKSYYLGTGTLDECKRKCENIYRIIEHAASNINYVSVEDLILQYYNAIGN